MILVGWIVFAYIEIMLYKEANEIQGNNYNDIIVCKSINIIEILLF